MAAAQGQFREPIFTMAKLSGLHRCALGFANLACGAAILRQYGFLSGVYLCECSKVVWQGYVSPMRGFRSQWAA